MTSRDEQRKQIRGLRRKLTVSERADAAGAAAESFVRTRLFRNSGCIALYLAVDAELDTAPLIERCWRYGKSVYLPVLSSDRHAHLDFVNYRPDSRLYPNRFGIPEPVALRGDLLQPRALDLVITPLVGFDADGNRLGMGGGYYDRTFAFLRSRRHWKKPRLIGFAYGFQQLPALTRESWDVPLDGVITEQGLLSCAGAGRP
jgi:5-formyltetrahydrofolate cyclo-ligase